MNVLPGRRILHHPAVIGMVIYLAEVLTRTDNSVTGTLLVMAAIPVSRFIIWLRRLFAGGARSRGGLARDQVTPICENVDGSRE